MGVQRRHFLQGLAASVGALAAFGEGTLRGGVSGTTTPVVADPSTVRDRLWMWGHVEGAYNKLYGLPGTSMMSPTEGAFYLGVPNVAMIEIPVPNERCNRLPAPPYDPYMLSFRPLKRVVWTIGGFGPPECIQRRTIAVYVNMDIEAIWQLASKYPNLLGGNLDIFFRDTLDGGRVSTLTAEELDYVRNRLKLEGRKLDLWVTFYRHDLERNPSEYLNKVDVATFWTWDAKDLATLEEAFAKFEQAAPKTRKVLGCCMWDFGGGKPMPPSLMEKQCRLGLEWLRKGRIEGIAFRASCICDLKIEAVEWTRNWIREVGDERI